MSDETRIAILMKSGTLADFTTLSMIVSGFVASDFEVKIFCMGDAVYAMKKDQVGTDVMFTSNYPEFADNLTDALNARKVTPWWELMADLKDLGEVEIQVCALVADVVHLEKEDFHELVDGIAGVANFAADVDDADFALTI